MRFLIHVCGFSAVTFDMSPALNHPLPSNYETLLSLMPSLHAGGAWSWVY